MAGLELVALLISLFILLNLITLVIDLADPAGDLVDLVPTLVCQSQHHYSFVILVLVNSQFI